MHKSISHQSQPLLLESEVLTSAVGLGAAGGILHLSVVGHIEVDADSQVDVTTLVIKSDVIAFERF